MANGILIVDKPEGWTSQDVVSKLRGVFHEKRVGHGGTLDPMATGILPVFFGRATRAVEFFEHAEKAYVATIRFGITTDTEDIWGTVLAKKDVMVSEEQLDAVLPQFLGEQTQIPPMYSAIKVNGQKLYDLARKGKEVERQPRNITVYEIRKESFQNDSCSIYIHCSKGTYIRTLCKDIGEALGCGACMASLRRVKAGVYEKGIALEKIIQSEHPETMLIPLDSMFENYRKISVTSNQEKCIRNGASFSTNREDGKYRAYASDGEFLALVEITDGVLKTVKSFFAV